MGYMECHIFMLCNLNYSLSLGFIQVGFLSKAHWWRRKDVCLKCLVWGCRWLVDITLDMSSQVSRHKWVGWIKVELWQGRSVMVMIYSQSGIHLVFRKDGMISDVQGGFGSIYNLHMSLKIYHLLNGVINLGIICRVKEFYGVGFWGWRNNAGIIMELK